MTVNILTLGCSKNLVDSEHLLAQFNARGYKVMHDQYGKSSDIVIINTCGFILDAKEESVETILAFMEEKRRGNLDKLFVMGCLSERYRDELKAELPEVDGFFGVWEMTQILEAAGSSLDNALLTDRVVTTPSHYAYLKIAEGCNRSCAFCTIPSIRGVQRSITIDDLVRETGNLAQKGVRELILIAQDLTSYGADLYGKRALPGLIRKLLRLKGIDWIRLHYAYPAGFPVEVVDMMAEEEKICHYLDIPIQHVNDDILSAMGRGHRRKSLEQLLFRIRDRIPDVALRTTVMTGFPGESEHSFTELLQFLEEFKFDRLGVFPYSHEEGTPAYRQLKDHIPDRVKEERVEAIMQLQQDISLQLNLEKVGKTYRVLVDRREGDFFTGRTQYDSPGVDNEVLIARDANIDAGEFYNIKITEAAEFDLFGVVV